MIAISSIVWILLCILVGKYAQGNRRSFWGFLLLSVVLSPLVGFLIALIVGKK